MRLEKSLLDDDVRCVFQFEMMMIWKNEMTYHMYISHARLSTHDVPGVRESARDAKTKQNVPRLAFERPKPHEREHRRVHERHDELFKSPMFPALVQPLDVLWSHRHLIIALCCLFFFFFFFSRRGFVCRAARRNDDEKEKE